MVGEGVPRSFTGVGGTVDLVVDFVVVVVVVVVVEVVVVDDVAVQGDPTGFYANN